MLKFYYNASPNPNKVALFLEESGLAYEVVPVETSRGQQFEPAFLAINPNAKVPAIVDDGVRVFDSNAILLYLAEKTGRFLPDDGAQDRADMLSWLMFIASGVGPYSGQAVHFKHFAPQKFDYALDRYLYEAKRHYEILDAQLARGPYLLGERYTLVDMAAWGWAGAVPFIFGDEAWGSLPHVKRWFDVMNSRPAVARVMALKQRHGSKIGMDDEAKKHMFRHIAHA